MLNQRHIYYMAIHDSNNAIIYNHRRGYIMKKIKICALVAMIAATALILGGCSSVVNMVEEKAASAIGEALGGSGNSGLTSTVGNLLGEEAGDLIGSVLGGSSSDDDSDSMAVSQEDSQALLQKLAERDGYQLTLKTGLDGSDSKITIGQTKDKWWSITDDNSGSGYVIEDGVYHFYDMYGGEWSYSNSVIEGSYGDMAATVSAMSAAYLYIGNAYNGLAKKSGTATVAGRKCDVYKYNIGSEALGYGSSYSICIDQEYGFTMKMEASATAGSDSGEVSYEVIEFVTGSGVKKPTFPAPDSYSVLDMSSGKWPDNEFTKLLPALPSNFEVYMTSLEGDTFSGVIQNVSESDARAYIEAVVKKGFGDRDGIQEYDGMVYFEGSNSKDQYASITFVSGSLMISITK